MNYLDLILGSLLLFLPAFIGNGAPVIFKRFGWLKNFVHPIDAGKKLWGERILGENKTYMGLLAALVGGAIGGGLQFLYIWFKIPVVTIAFGWSYFLIGGAGMGLAAILGDTVKSFFKRRLKIKAGRPLLIFDQIDYLIGAYLFVLVAGYYNTGWQYFLVAVLISIPAHFLLNVLAYKLGWKKVWW